MSDPKTDAPTAPESSVGLMADPRTTVERLLHSEDEARVKAIMRSLTPEQAAHLVQYAPTSGDKARLLGAMERLQRALPENGQHFLCSNEAIDNSFWTGRMDLPPGDGPNQRNLRFSYGGNAWAVDGANNRPTYHKQLIGVMSLYGGFTDLGREVTEIKQPSETIMIADAWSLGIGGPYGADYCGDDDPFYLPLTMLNNPYPLRDAISLRHKDGFNAVFVDAHVRWLRQTTRQMWAADPSQVSSYAWACPEKKTR